MGLIYICCFKIWLNYIKEKLLLVIGYLYIVIRRKKSFVFVGIKIYKDFIFWEYYVWFFYFYVVLVIKILGIWML